MTDTPPEPESERRDREPRTQLSHAAAGGNGRTRGGTARASPLEWAKVGRHTAYGLKTVIEVSTLAAAS